MLLASIVVAMGATIAPVSVSAAATPSAETLRSTEGVEVPVHGVVRYRAPDGYPESGNVTAAVHGVHRLDGATALYWSAGTRDERELGSQSLGRRSTQPIRSWVPYNWTGYAHLTDPVTLQGLDGSTIDGQTNLSSPTEAFPRDGAGTMWVMFQLFPELPPETTTVDVTLGTGATVRDVPVADGPLSPTLPADQPIALGDGWPEIEDSLLSADPTPDLSHFPLSSERAALDGSETEIEATDQVRVELSADVLFDVASAEVGPDAIARLEELAAVIRDDALDGPLGITGHTDSDGADDDNIDLSERRARAVADILLPLLVDAEFEPVVQGRGETDPLATNATDEGKQANRRVTITYAPDRSDESS